MVNFVLVADEIVSLVSGTPANFNGSRAAALPLLFLPLSIVATVAHLSYC